jgi:hypothetical protein
MKFQEEALEMLFVKNFKFYSDLGFEKINAHFNVKHFTNIYISIYIHG